jgi:N-acetyl sugar amidotransferase
MKYCIRCVQPDTRPNSIFTKKGICPACNYFESLKDVDWDERFELLKDIISRFKKENTMFNDCIMGVSGGKDSTRQALFLRDKLGLNPLLVCLSYPPDQVTEIGADNISNLINLGFDVIISAPGPQTWKKLKQEGFKRFANSFRSTEMALFASVPQIAINYGIKLIFWGENPALQVGDMKMMGKTGYDGNNSRHMNTLSSGFSWMREAGFGLNELIPYRYPTIKEFDDSNLEIIYLGWFLGDWSLLNNGLYACANGLVRRKDTVEKTGDLYGVSAIDEDFTPVNQLIKYYKFGFGRVTEYANEEIRLNRITRKEGISLVEKYEGQLDKKYIINYCDYLKISTNDFWNEIKNSFNKDLFIMNSNKKIIKKFKVGVGL